MSFYLLKSTNDRELVGDCIFVRSDISAIKGAKVVSKKETYFAIVVFLRSGYECKASFNTEDEAKNIIKDLGVDPIIVDDFLFQQESLIEKEEALQRMREIFG